MISDVQREVTVHLLANALRKRRAPNGGLSPDDGAGNRRRRQNDDYLQGMLDLLTVLYGRVLTDELFRDAQALERSTSAG